MKREIKELKRIARGNLQGHFLGLIRALVFCDLIVSLIETPFSMMTNDAPFSPTNIIYYIAILLITIVSVVLTVGQYCLHLRIARSGEFHLSELFYPLRYDANRLIIAEVILCFFRLIGLAPAIGAGVIVYFYEDINMYLVALGLAVLGCIMTVLIEVTFSMTYFALIDGEELSVGQAIAKALRIIKGYKGRFLYLMLSFIGMYLLAALTLGLGLLWVQPYVMQTTTLFYLDINGELDEVLERRKESEPTPEPVAYDHYA